MGQWRDRVIAKDYSEGSIRRRKIHNNVLHSLDVFLNFFFYVNIYFMSTFFWKVTRNYSCQKVVYKLYYISLEKKYKVTQNGNTQVKYLYNTLVNVLRWN